MWNHTGAGYREYSRKGRENEKEVERFSRFCEEFANYEREPGQDMTLLVTADGKAVKKIYYTRIFYDRIVFQTQGSYIPPVYGNRGDDIREEMSRIPEPERPGYIFLGWEPELPETMPEGELTVHALWEQGESQYTVLRWMEHAEDEEYSLLGDQEETAKIVVRTAAAGIAVLLLLAVRKKKRLALK